MAEARQLKTGRWRIYERPRGEIIRDPDSGAIVTFDSIDTARMWWAQLRPEDPPLLEAIKCARCGGYFGHGMAPIREGARYYHAAHRPRAAVLQRGR